MLEISQRTWLAWRATWRQTQPVHYNFNLHCTWFIHKIPKNSDTWTISVIKQCRFYHAKMWLKICRPHANKEGPDQTPLIWVFIVCQSSQCLIWVCTVCRDLIILIVKRESLFSCFIIKAGSMDKSKNLSIYSGCKKDMKQNYFVEFHIVQGGGGQYSESFNLPLANSTRDRQ